MKKQTPQAVAKKFYRRVRIIKMILLWVVSIAVTLGFTFLPLAIPVTVPNRLPSIIFMIAAIIGYLVPLWLSIRFTKKMNAIPVAQRISMMKEQQAATRGDLSWAVKRLKRAGRHMIFAYVLFFVLLTLGLMSAPDLESRATLATVFWAGYFSLFSKVLNLWSPVCRDIENAASPEAYPRLHATVRRAADAIGCKGDIAIELRHDCNAGIVKLGKGYHIQLGTALWSVLTEEELYQVMLHEFAHMTDPHIVKYDKPLGRLFNMASGDGFCGFTLYAETRFTFERMMYLMLASEQLETYADQMLKEKGDPATAAAALAKTGMYVFYDQHESIDRLPSFYASEAPRDNIATLTAETFRETLDERKDFWMHLFDIELIPQTQSHPIFRERRKALGAADLPLDVSLPSLDTPFGQECVKAMKQTDEHLFSLISTDYANDRARLYQQPLKIIEDYEKSETPYTTAELSPVINAYRDTDQRDRALAICEHILATEENVFATAHALYFKGCYLLNHYNPAGMDLIYQAMDINKNYVEEGIDLIGQFCCTMGLEAEREVYREKYVELMQYNMDKWDHAGVLAPSDHLVAESFPDDRLPRMLEYMIKVGEGHIHSIYLVRKIITDDFFVSPFVIRFEEGTSDEQINKAMTAIFHFLDTTPEDWNYALFLYDEPRKKAVEKVKGSLVWKKEQVPSA